MGPVAFTKNPPPDQFQPLDFWVALKVGVSVVWGA
jgi:hypothetical protein